MVFVEDAFALIAAHWSVDAFGGALATSWHIGFIASIANQIDDGRALSVQQAAMVGKMLSVAGPYLVAKGVMTRTTLDDLQTTPRYRQPLYTSRATPMRNEVRLLGAHYLGLRFRYNGKLLVEVRALTLPDDIERAWFHRANRIWVVPVTRWNLRPIQSLIATHRFEMDTATRDYLMLAKYSQNKPSTMLYHADSNAIVVNVCDNPLLACWVRHVAGGDML